MKPRHVQIGIEPGFSVEGPPDYSGKQRAILNQQVTDFIRKQGLKGATAAETATYLGHPHKSIAGRCTELCATGVLRRTEARRRGVVYLVVESKLEGVI